MFSLKYNLGSHLCIFQWVLQGADVAFENHVQQVYLKKNNILVNIFSILPQCASQVCATKKGSLRSQPQCHTSKPEGKEAPPWIYYYRVQININHVRLYPTLLFRDSINYLLNIILSLYILVVLVVPHTDTQFHFETCKATKFNVYTTLNFMSSYVVRVL